MEEAGNTISRLAIAAARTLIPSIFIGILVERSSAQLTNVVVTSPRRIRSPHSDLKYQDRHGVFEKKAHAIRDLESDGIRLPSLSFSLATDISEYDASNHQTLNFVRAYLFLLFT